MAFSSEVTGRLGVDTSSVPADLAKAKTAFKQFGGEVQNEAEAHGAGAGGKLVGALEHKIAGSRHLAGALATALGLNIEHIAEGIVAGIVGGTKEAWKQAAEISEENAKLIEKRLELALTPKQLQERIKANSARAAGDVQGAGADTATEKFVKGLERTSPVIGFIAEKFGLVRSQAEKLVEINEKTNKSLESDVRLEEQKKTVKEAQKKLDEFKEQSASKGLSDSEKEKKLDEERQKLLTDIAYKNGSDLEIIEKKHRLVEIDNQQREDALAKQDRQIEKDKQLLKLRMSLVEAQRKLAQDEEDLANKKADRGKLSVDEIAKLTRQDTSAKFGENTHVDTFGLSAEAAQAKQTAVDIQRLQKQAEGLRVSGDSAGANALFDQIGTKKQSLVDSGFAKSTEGDEFKQLNETIHKDSVEIQKILSQITDVAKGKLKNE